MILFLYAFGTRDDPPVDLDPARYRPLLSALLVSCCASGSWDLVAELLLCWECLGLDRSALVDGAWTALLSRQEDDGAFPGHGAATHDDDEAKRFAARYHTTLVVVMACAARLRRGATRARAVARLGRAQPVPRARLRELASVEAEWLARNLERVASGGGRPGAAPSLLVGLWLCTAIDGELAPALADAARLLPACAIEPGTWMAVPPVVSLVTYGMLDLRRRVRGRS